MIIEEITICLTIVYKINIYFFYFALTLLFPVYPLPNVGTLYLLCNTSIFQLHYKKPHSIKAGTDHLESSIFLHRVFQNISSPDSRTSSSASTSDLDRLATSAVPRPEYLFVSACVSFLSKKKRRNQSGAGPVIQLGGVLLIFYSLHCFAMSLPLLSPSFLSPSSYFIW